VRWRWPWRRERDGAHARETKAAADRNLIQAREQTRRVDEATLAARQMARRVDQFTADVERTLHLRGHA
jgi:hypothetical protein